MDVLERNLISSNIQQARATINGQWELVMRASIVIIIITIAIYLFT